MRAAASGNLTGTKIDDPLSAYPHDRSSSITGHVRATSIVGSQRHGEIEPFRIRSDGSFGDTSVGAVPFMIAV
jgi:hypothetical protein